MTDPATGNINWRLYAPRVSPAFAAVLDKSTETYLHERYSTAVQMCEDLRKALCVNEHAPAPRPLTTIEEETVIRPVALQPPAPDPRRRGYALYFAVAAAVLSLLAVIGSAAVLARLEVQNREEDTATTSKPSSARQGSPTEKPPIPARTPATTAATAQTATTSRETPLPPVATADVPDRFPEASTRLLTTSDLVDRSPWELRVMRNEIFARHGYIFKTPEMRSYFAGQRWYSPRRDDVSMLLSEIEAQNVKLIRSTE